MDFEKSLVYKKMKKNLAWKTSSPQFFLLGRSILTTTVLSPLSERRNYLVLPFQLQTQIPPLLPLPFETRWE